MILWFLCVILYVMLRWRAERPGYKESNNRSTKLVLCKKQCVHDILVVWTNMKCWHPLVCLASLLGAVLGGVEWILYMAASFLQMVFVLAL